MSLFASKSIINVASKRLSNMVIGKSYHARVSKLQFMPSKFADSILADLNKSHVIMTPLTQISHIQRVSVKHYSTRDQRQSRRQQTTVEDRPTREEQRQTQVAEQKQGWWGSRQESQEEPQQQQQTTWYADPDTTTENMINTHVMSHMRRVYSTVGVATGIAALASGAGIAMGLGAGAGLLGLAAMIPMLGVYFTDPAKVTLRQNLLFATAGLLGLGATPLLAASTAASVVIALGGTTAIFAGFTLAALRAKSTTFLQMGGVLMGGVFALLLTIPVILFGPALGIPASIIAAASNINLYGGLALFSIFIAYDTQAMIVRAASGVSDHVTDALNLFLDGWFIFIRLLSILGMKSD